MQIARSIGCGCHMAFIAAEAARARSAFDGEADGDLREFAILGSEQICYLRGRPLNALK